MPLGLNSSWSLKLVGWLLVLLGQICQGSEMTIMTGGEIYVLNPGETITLGCEFSARNYNLFDYPVLWRKYQLGEHTVVNIMGNIKKPYDIQNRFQVQFSEMNPRYRLEIKINEVMKVDSGNYTCEVRAPQSKIVGQITHQVYVRDHVSSLMLTSDNGTTHSISTRGTSSPVATLTVTENEPVGVQCIAVGGYPPPNLEIFLDSKDVTHVFQFSHTAHLNGPRGLRTIVYETSRITQTFIPTADDDEKRLKCIAAVPGLNSNISFVKLNVLYGPRIQCHRSGAFLGDRNVDIKCEIKSKPPIVTLLWIIDNNGTSISEVGEVTDGHWMKRNDLDEGVTETQLFVRQAKLTNFRIYSLIAKNEVAETKEDVSFFRKDTVSTNHHTDNKPRTGRKNLENDTQKIYYQGYLLLVTHLIVLTRECFM